MNRPLAFLFAVIGVLLLVGISYGMAAGRPLLAVLFALSAVLFIGIGFMIKTKQRRR